MRWYRWQPPDLLLNLKIQAGAARSEIAGLHGEALKIRVQAPAVEGRANRELIRFLSDAFGVPKSKVILVRGESSPLKTVRIQAPKRLPADLIALDAALSNY